MKVSIQADRFAAALKTVSPALARRPVIMATKNFRLAADDTSLFVEATDGNGFFLGVACNAKVEMPGEILVDPRISKVASAAGDAILTLKTHRKRLYITGYGETNMATVSADAFPRPAEQEFGSIVPLNQRTIKALSVSVGADYSVPKNCGIHVMSEGDKTYLATTESGFWWSIVIVEGDEEESLLIPFRYAALALKAFPDAKLAAGKRHITAILRNITIPLFESAIYPSAPKLTGLEANLVLKPDYEALLKALKLAVMFSEKSSPTKMSYKEGMLVLKSGGNEIGSFDKSIDVVVESGEGEIANRYSAKRLLMALQDTGPEAKLEFCEWPKHPGWYTIRISHDNILHLLSPLQLK